MHIHARRSERLAIGKHFASLGGPLRGGDAADCLDSRDIDSVLFPFTNLSFVPAEFCRIVREQRATARSLFLSAATSFPVVIPFHAEFHWMALVVFEKYAMFADSCPKASHLTAVESLLSVLEDFDGQKRELCPFVVPRQPIGSTQCGVHAIVNSLAIAFDLSQQQDGVICYNDLRKQVSLAVSRSACFVPSTFLLRARCIAASANVPLFRPLSRGAVLRFFDFLGEDAEIAIGYASDPRILIRPSVLDRREGGCWFSVKGNSLPTSNVVLAVGLRKWFPSLAPAALTGGADLSLVPPPSANAAVQVKHVSFASPLVSPVLNKFPVMKGVLPSSASKPTVTDSTPVESPFPAAVADPLLCEANAPSMGAGSPAPSPSRSSVALPLATVATPFPVGFPMVSPIIMAPPVGLSPAVSASQEMTPVSSAALALPSSASHISPWPVDTDGPSPFVSAPLRPQDAGRAKRKPAPVVVATTPVLAAAPASVKSYLSVAKAAAPLQSAATVMQLPGASHLKNVAASPTSSHGAGSPSLSSSQVLLPAPMTHSEVIAGLRRFSVGSWLEVDWSHGTPPQFTWVGRLVSKASHGAWNIEFVNGSRLVPGSIPRRDITYHAVRATGVPSGYVSASSNGPIASRLRPRASATTDTVPVQSALALSPFAAPVAASSPAAPPSAVAATIATGASPFPFVRRSAMAVDFSQRRGVVRTARPPPSPRLRTAPPSPLGTGIPELDELYADLHLSKNVPLPDALTRHSGDKMKTVDLLHILRQPEVAIPHPMYKGHLAPTTIASHKRVLRWLRDHLPSSDTPVAVSIGAFVAQQAKSCNWAPTSWLTKLNNIHGALAALFVYRKSQDQVVLAGCPQWNTHLSTVQRMKPLHKPNQPRAMTQAELIRAMQLEPRPEVRAALEIGWAAASRGNDLRQLLASDILFPPPLGGRSDPVMTITFRRGKTAKKEQYTVGVPLPSAETRAYINQKKVDNSWVFPGVQGEHIKKALRRANPVLEQRSIRRGRLQQLSAEGWPDEKLRELSQHATVQMLRRYLDMGVMSSTTHEIAALAARGATSL